MAPDRYPRYRPHPRGKVLQKMRLSVCARAGFRCQECQVFFPVPPGWDGNYPLFIYVTRRATPRRPIPWEVVRLELGHIVSWLDGGPFHQSNFRALCTPCNHAQGREVPT